jgi:hypothetical protein
MIRYGTRAAMSALPLKAGMCSAKVDVRSAPNADTVKVFNIAQTPVSRARERLVIPRDCPIDFYNDRSAK